jgi:rhodanese-related sulfurtransferase
MKLIPTLLAFALVAFTTLATADEVKHVKSKEAAAIVAKGDVVVLDVRTADEYADGHIEGAKNIDFLDDAKFKTEAAKLDKSKTYLVHCQAGGRSSKSLKTLQELGITNLIHLDDGFGGWSDSGLPVKK